MTRHEGLERDIRQYLDSVHIIDAHEHLGCEPAFSEPDHGLWSALRSLCFQPLP